MALSCDAPTAVGMVTSAGLQLMVGVRLVTTSVTLALPPVKLAASEGVNATESVCVPTGRIVPVVGEYAKLPAVEAVALSCVAPSAVPYGIAAGVLHERTAGVFGFKPIP